MSSIEEDILLTEESNSEDNYLFDLSIPIWAGRIIGLSLFVLVILLGYFFFPIKKLDIINMFFDVRYTIPIVVTGFFISEILQAIALLIFARLGFSQIRFGMDWNNMSPFVHARRPIELKYYRIYLIISIILAGLVFLAIAYFYESKFFLLYSAFIFSQNGSNIITFFRSLTQKGDLLTIDHPKEMGCRLYENPFV